MNHKLTSLLSSAENLHTIVEETLFRNEAKVQGRIYVGAGGGGGGGARAAPQTQLLPSRFKS